MSDSSRPHGLQHTRLPCPSLSPWVGSNSCPLSQWFHPTISSPIAPFSSCPQSFPASGSFPMSQLFASDGQSIGGSASASVLPMNIQSWFPLGLSSLISLLFKGLSRVFSSTTVWKHGFFSTQPSKGFPCGSAGKESACNVGDLGSIPGLGRSPGEGKRLPTPVHWPVEFHGLQSMGSKRVWLFKRHDWGTFTFSFLYGPILTVNGTLQIRLTKTKLTGGGKKEYHVCIWEV